MFVNQVITIILSVAYVHAWDYAVHNPNAWPYLEGESYSKCGSHMQSPINIITEHVRCDSSRSFLKPIRLVGYSVARNFTFSNYKLTVLSSLQDANAGYMYEGSGIPRTLAPFELAQFHFHWGQHNFEGSEHTIDYKYAPLELHLVHVSTRDPKYFAVIGILFEISQFNNTYLNNIIEAADYLATHVNSSIVKSIKIEKLLPRDLNRFYYYEGSLTTPPCTERVFWTVMADRVPISEYQLKHLQSNPSKVNFRPPQPVNERLVTTLACDLAGDYNSNAARTLKSSLLMLYSLFLLTLSRVDYI